jgi:hypothetical protein
VFETLHRPQDLAGWLAAPPLTAALTVPATDGDLTAAKALRQAIWATAHEQAAGQPLAGAPPYDLMKLFGESREDARTGKRCAYEIGQRVGTTRWMVPSALNRNGSMVVSRLVPLPAGIANRW